MAKVISPNYQEGVVTLLHSDSMGCDSLGDAQNPLQIFSSGWTSILYELLEDSAEWGVRVRKNLILLKPLPLKAK